MRKHPNARLSGGLIGGPETMRKLTAVQIKNFGDGKYQDGGGLILIKKGNRGKWIYRYSLFERRREMGLGSLQDFSLAEARKRRDAAAALVAQGVDPIDDKRRNEAEQKAAHDRSDPLFKDMVDLTLAAIADTLKEGGESGRWKSPLLLHVIPKLRGKRMSQIGSHHIEEALRPI